MEWSKDKTLHLIELLQVHPSLWNTSLCDTRRDKQKRKEELRNISMFFGVTVSDITKKIQHLRTQYNREAAREARFNSEDPNFRYVSNWYAFEYLHFMKTSAKTYRVLHTVTNQPSDANMGISSQTAATNETGKLVSQSPQHNPEATESLYIKPEVVYPSVPMPRDELSVFGEYVANELRSLKGEKNLLVAKKKIQDVIFEVKMGLINEPQTNTNSDNSSTCTEYIHMNPHNTNVVTEKIYSSPLGTTTHMESLPTSHNSNEIIISNTCHYPTFKVDDE